MHIYTSREEIEVAVSDRIKPRLKEVLLCGKVSRKMFDSKETFDKAAFELGDLKVNFGANHRDLTDPIIDTGIMMVRVMIQFLGFTVKLEDLSLQQYSARANDVTIKSFGLPLPSSDESSEEYIFNALNKDEINAIKLVAIKTNNGVAHLTVNETKTIGLDVLALACESILKVIEKKLLEPLKIDNDKTQW